MDGRRPTHAAKVIAERSQNTKAADSLIAGRQHLARLRAEHERDLRATCSIIARALELRANGNPK